MRAAVLLGREDDDGEHAPFVLVDGLLFRRDTADLLLAACDGNGDAPEPVYYARRPLVTRW